MHTDQIPVKLTLPEICAAALLNSADELAEARDATEFVDALNAIHRLWQTLREMAPLKKIDGPGFGDTHYAVSKLGKRGIAMDDSHVEALVKITRRTALDLASVKDGRGLLNRARLACDEAEGADLDQWLLTQIVRRSRSIQAMEHYQIEEFA